MIALMGGRNQVWGRFGCCR